MLDKVPERSTLIALMGPQLTDTWDAVCTAVDARYNMEHVWDKGGKAWTYVYRFRRGGKTLCTLCARENEVGLMLVFGGAERERFEAVRSTLSEAALQAFDTAETYHDGKWVMFDPTALTLPGELDTLLAIKRRPNRK